MKNIIIDTIAAGKHILLVGTCKSVRKMLKNQGVLSLLNADNIFQKRLDALVHAQALLSD